MRRKELPGGLIDPGARAGLKGLGDTSARWNPSGHLTEARHGMLVPFPRSYVLLAHQVRSVSHLAATGVSFGYVGDADTNIFGRNIITDFKVGFGGHGGIRGQHAVA